MKLSIISPVYGAASLLVELVSEIEEAVRSITSDYEIILVEDHSPDDSQEIIRQIATHNPRVKGLFLSKNYGQQLAINAGLDAASGDWIVTLDCDLQDTPEYIKDMYEKAKEGYDIVFASRQNRQDTAIKKLGSKYFNRLLGFLTEMQQDESIANYVLYRKAAVEAMRSMGDYRRYYPLMNHWIGFRTFNLPIPHAERADGRESSYTLMKRIQLALNTSVAFSTKPLRLIVYLGFIMTALSMVLGIGLVANYIFSDTKVSGWLTLFVSLWFIAGILVMVMGIVAVYIGEIFIQAKHRPAYIISNSINI